MGGIFLSQQALIDDEAVAAFLSVRQGKGKSFRVMSSIPWISLVDLAMKKTPNHGSHRVRPQLKTPSHIPPLSRDGSCVVVHELLERG
jgi:hypothetical protein